MLTPATSFVMNDVGLKNTLYTGMDARNTYENLAMFSNGVLFMATNGIDMQVTTRTTTRRRNFHISGLAIRLLIAFLVSWLIILAFFATGAVSH